MTKAIDVKCDTCKAGPGEPCTGRLESLHDRRYWRAKVRDTIAEADTLALDNSRDRRTLEELLMEALR